MSRIGSVSESVRFTVSVTAWWERTLVLLLIAAAAVNFALGALAVGALLLTCAVLAVIVAVQHATINALVDSIEAHLPGSDGAE